MVRGSKASLFCFPWVGRIDEAMTPSEKKARESLLSEAQALTLDWTRHKHLEGYPRLDERIALALDIAEHRGFMAGFQAHKDMIEANRA